MAATNNQLSLLRRELEFLDHGGYRTPVHYRQPLFCMETSTEERSRLFFEDSPSCPKRKPCPCPPEGGCTLLGLVPNEHQHETVPCRHIPLNEKGETIDSLYRAGNTGRIETELRNWLVKEIEKFEQTDPGDLAYRNKTAV